MNHFDVWNASLQGQILIEASAGTGKTYTLSAIYLRHLLENEKLLPEDLLVLTFTNAATSELKNRLRNLLHLAKLHLQGTASPGDQAISAYLDGLQDKDQALNKLNTALLSFDQASIFTIHSFCKTVINEFNSECGSPCFYQRVDIQDHLQKWIYDFYRSQLQSAPQKIMSFAPLPHQLLQKMNSLLNKRHFRSLPPTTDWKQFCQLSKDIEDLQQQWGKQKQQLMDYLLSGHLTKVSYNPTKRAQYEEQIEDFFRGKFAKTFKNYFASEIESKSKQDVAVPNFFYKLESIYYLIYNPDHNVNLIELSYAHACWQWVLEKQQELFLNEGLFGFDHFVETVEQACKTNVKLRKSITQRWPVLMVDEFQDTDSLQLSIFDQCYLNQNSSVVFVGDPKQAIYDFRGGDVFVYQQAKEKISRHYQLSTNWRSSSVMLDATNQLFAAESAFHLPWMQFQASQPSPAEKLWEDERKGSLFVMDGDEEQQIQTMAKEIQRLLKDAKMDGSKALCESDIAVLVNNNKQAKSVYHALLFQGLKVSLWSEDSVMASETAKDLYYFIRALQLPTLRNINTSLHSPFFAWSLAEIHSKDKEQRLSLFLEMRSQLATPPLPLALQQLIQNQSIDLKLLQRRDGERRWMDLQHMMELISAKFYHSGSLQNLLDWLLEEMTDPTTLDDEDLRKRKLESDGDKITVQTIHKSKGLEYAVVFAPNIDSISENLSQRFKGNLKIVEALHDQNLHGFINWQVHDSSYEQLIDEQLAVQRRKLYVALTRSKFRLYLGFDSSKSKFSESTSIGKLLETSSVPYETLELQDLSTTIRDSIEKVKLDFHRFTAKLHPPQRISSFSGLNALNPAEHHIQMETTEPELDFSDYLHFPKGAVGGTLIHEILEQLPFDSNAEKVQSLVAEQLHRYQFSSQWQAALTQQLLKILNTPLWLEGPKLRDIKNKIVEMEFLLPFNESHSLAPSQWLSSHRNQPVEFEFESIKGFLSGFIDLVFEWQGKYYVLDYKSNHLGYEPESYSNESLQQSIYEHNYDLQYLLYSVALIKSLKARVPDFLVDKHFGGVVYLFTRGVNGTAADGIYFQRPSEKLLKLMEGSFDA